MKLALDKLQIVFHIGIIRLDTQATLIGFDGFFQLSETVQAVTEIIVGLIVQWFFAVQRFFISLYRLWILFSLVQGITDIIMEGRIIRFISLGLLIRHQGFVILFLLVQLIAFRIFSTGLTSENHRHNQNHPDHYLIPLKSIWFKACLDAVSKYQLLKPPHPGCFYHLTVVDQRI